MGYEHPDYLLEKLKSTQISEWEAYNTLDPIGKWRDDFHMAALLAKMENLVKDIYSKDRNRASPIDFMPEWGMGEQEKEPKMQSVEEQKRILLEIAGNQNRIVAKQGNRMLERNKRLAKKVKK